MQRFSYYMEVKNNLDYLYDSWIVEIRSRILTNNRKKYALYLPDIA